MRVVGNIRQIKQQRDTSNQEVALHLDKVEYITHRKDGKYYQPFDFVEELDTPLVITGDCLALAGAKHVKEGENSFVLFDKVADDYVLNENKQLALTVAHDFDSDTTLVTSATYIVTVSNEEFTQLKSARNKARKQTKSRKGR